MGAFAFITGLLVIAALFQINDDSPVLRLYYINAYVSTAIVYLALGGFLVVDAASALGRTSSVPLAVRRPWLPLIPFPFAVTVGQWLASNPEAAPWAFPFVNVLMVSSPSLTIALVVANRYTAHHPFAWPVSRREWSSGFVYGAVGATSIASIINTAYLLGAGHLLVQLAGNGGPFSSFERNLHTLPTGWGIFLDLSTLSIVAPLNEEFWKGMLVGFFFFRRGGLARCFLWGVLAGTGFNLLETFSNSLGVVSPEARADQTIGSEWWFFAVARAGTAAMHGTATGLTAIGFYGLFRRHPRYLPGLVAGPSIHGLWNFLVYTVWGDALFTGAGPDSTLLDVAGGLGLVILFGITLVLLWNLSGTLRDDAPAPPYRLLGMLPGATASGHWKPPPSSPLWATEYGGQFPSRDTHDERLAFDPELHRSLAEIIPVGLDGDPRRRDFQVRRPKPDDIVVTGYPVDGDPSGDPQPRP